MTPITLEDVVRAWRNNQELASSNGVMKTNGQLLVVDSYWVLGITHKRTGKKLALNGYTRKYIIDKTVRKYAKLADQYADEVHDGVVLMYEWMFPVDVLRDAFKVEE